MNDIKELTPEEYQALSPTEKGKYTYRRNREARERWKQEHFEQEKADRAALLVSLRKVRDDDRSTPEQVVFAVTAIDSLQGYHHIPYDLKHPHSNHKATVADFKRELESLQQTK